MAAGDIVKTHAFSIEKVDVDTDEDIVEGEVIIDKGGYGFEQADLGDGGPFMIALEDHDYSEETTHTIRALFSGIIKVKKATGAISKGRYVVVSSTSGAVTQAAYSDLATDIYKIVGIANDDAASGDTTVAVRVRC